MKEKESEGLCGEEQRQPNTSSVSSITLASAAEKDEDVRTNTSAASGIFISFVLLKTLILHITVNLLTLES